MNFCDHHIWLQIFKFKNFVFHDTNKFSKLLSKLTNSSIQKSLLIFLIDKKFKNVVIREMFSWNNVKKIKRNEIVIFRVKTSTIKFINFILFDESDFFATINEKSIISFLCHQIYAHSIQWICKFFEILFDIIHNRLFYFFVDVLCIFVDDFESFDHVVHRLKIWTNLNKKMHVHDYTTCKIIIIKNDHEFSSNFTFDILKKMNFQFNFF